MNPIQLPYLTTRKLGKIVYEHEEVSSTQDVLKESIHSDTPSGFTVLAKRQSQGRGRQGRTWFDIPGEQIFASILLRSNLPNEKLPILNIAAGLAVCDALEELGVRQVALKWPNDVFVGGKKISGILSELLPGRNGIILGIGLNVEGKTKDLPNDLRLIVTALEQQISETSRLKTFALILNHLESWMDALENKGSQPIQEEFKKRWIYSGLSIVVKIGDEAVTGISTEIDAIGSLLLQTDKGIKKILSGDISARLNL